MLIPKIFSIFTLFSFVAGCATEFSDYEGSSTRAAVANICEQKGLITSDDFSHYSQLQLGWGARQNMKIVDDEKLQSMYIKKLEEMNRWGDPYTEKDKQEFRLLCAQIAVAASNIRGVHSAPTKIAPTYSSPRTTSCMTNWGFTTCTSN